ncbi:putative protein OS=Ureibacillus acetophenoni OX=614649 GN=SAMN05877842_102168 PE=4 SV=1 [Ureibacillus acetophenoni]
MDFPIILMIIGILCMVLSFFMKDSSKKLEKDVEDLSISIYQETNSIKRRLKIVEEELLLEPNFHVKPPVNNKQSAVENSKSSEQVLPSTYMKSQVKKSKPVHEILVRQVIELDKQGHSISEISKLSTLTVEQISDILRNHGGTK